MKPIIDIEELGFDSGAHLLLKRGLSGLSAGEEIEIRGHAPEWQAQVSAWCRQQGHKVYINTNDRCFVIKRETEKSRWLERAQNACQNSYQKSSQDGQNIQILDNPSSKLGLSARGAQVEISSPEFQFRLNKKVDVWSPNIRDLYQQAIAAQWNADLAIDWTQPRGHSNEVEEAIVQIFTYMIENENAALIVPAKFLSQLHPHFREVQALLSIQIADEARHIDVFNRRIELYGSLPAFSTAGGQASLKTLLDEPDFNVVGFLLSVLGEGTFVDLLQFLNRFAPDLAMKQITLLAAKDEARHVSFGMSHLLEKLTIEPDFRTRLKMAVMDRYDLLSSTEGLNEEVFDSLIMLAAGNLRPKNINQGFREVQLLMKEMKEGRRARLERLGFSNSEASELSAQHTRNFM